MFIFAAGKRELVQKGNQSVMQGTKLNFFDLLIYPFRVPNFLFLKTLLMRKISYKEVRYNYFNNSIYLKKLDYTVSKNHNFFLLQGIDIVHELIDVCGAKFSFDQKGGVKVSIDGLDIFVNFWEELFIMKEIFKDGIYNVETVDQFVLVDIGMNVGMTSLFFSRKPNCTKTYSFEPFLKTYEYARKNIDQNPQANKKINTFNFGIGIKDEEKTIEYFLDYKGSVGTEGIPDRVVTGATKLVSETVRLQSAESCVRRVRDENKNEKLYAKIDCEGAEYDILKQLDSTGLLKEFEIIMMEWHNKGPGELLEILKKNGYVSYSFWPHNKDIGMLYSYKVR